MSSYFSLAPYYDLLTDDVDYGAFADYYEEMFKKYGGEVKTVLDLACGTGTLTCILAERGYEMIGIDASEEMLAVAADKAEGKSFAIEPMWLNQSVQELDLYGTVDAAVCSLDGINYVPEDELDMVFDRLRLFIRPGGLFIFDINTPQKLRGLDGQLFVDEDEDVLCLWRAEFDENENACYYGMDIFTSCGDGRNFWKRYFEEHIEYAHSIKMLVEKLKNAGFETAAVEGEFTRESPAEDEQRVFITAARA